MINKNYNIILVTILVLFADFSDIYSQNIIINEIMSSNDSTFADEDGDYNDWIELYNPTSTSISISNWKISDDITIPNKCIIPNISIGSKEFLVIIASGKNKNGTKYYHTNFKIKSEGEIIMLSDDNSNIIDIFSPAYVPEHYSYGRIPDGSNTLKTFIKPSPEISNNNSDTTFNYDIIEFSHKAGYYTYSFNLTLTKRDIYSTIYYTTDGSTPTVNSFKYYAPITLTDISNSYDKISIIPTSDKWYMPEEKSNKINIIRAAVFSGNTKISKTYTKSFCINASMPSRYSFPIVSISTDNENLFDDDKGIFIKGENNSDDDANYFQKGIEWERPVYIEYFNKKGEIELSQNAGIRIHGESSRSLPQKSMTVYARNDYGEKYFNYKLHKNRNVSKYKRFILRSASGSDWKGSMFKDELNQIITKDLNLDHQAFNPVILFINGEYWGVHYVKERFDKYYAQDVLGNDNIDLIQDEKNAELGSLYEYNKLLNYITDNDLSINSNYDYIKTQIDIDNFIDYNITQIFISNKSFPWHNIRLWKGKNNISKWRYILYDTDNTLDDESFNHLSEYRDINNPYNRYPDYSNFIIYNLLKNDSFNQMFISKFYFHMSNTFEINKMINTVDSFTRILEPEVVEHSKRWNHPNDYLVWRNIIAEIKDFFIERPIYIHKQLIEEFGNPFKLYPNPASNYIKIEPFGINEKDMSFSIFSANGSIISTGFIPKGTSIKEINTSYYKSGLYYLQLKYNQFVFYSKFIVCKN